jgi:hypothetical protein
MFYSENKDRMKERGKPNNKRKKEDLVSTVLGEERDRDRG